MTARVLSKIYHKARIEMTAVKDICQRCGKRAFLAAHQIWCPKCRETMTSHDTPFAI